MRNVSTLERPAILSAALFIFVICLLGISASNVQAATITVTGTGDNIAVDGQCTLREAITAANTNAAVNDCPAGDGADTINFDTAGAFAVPQTITLTTDQLVISSDLTISGVGADKLTISGNNACRVFFIGEASVTLDGLTITGGNTVGSFGNHGGAIEQVSGTLTITNSRVTGNSAELAGGGIHSQFSVLAIINSMVSDNTANGSGGGVIVSLSALTVTGSTVSGNTAVVGGGIYNNGGTLTVQRSTISGNSSGNGGGIFASTGTTNLTNTTISGNSGNSGLGGGIYYDGGTSTVTNSTILGNASTYAGSVYNSGGDIHLDSTIVANGYSPASCGGIAGDVTANYSLLQDAVCGNLSGGNNLTGVSAMVGPLQYNGGSTKTHALLAGSPAIDAGSNPSALTTDQRGTGFDRVVGPAADIGSFEIQPACAGVSFAAANNFAAGDGPASVAVGDFNGDGKTDLAIPYTGPDYVSVLLGNGDATFAAAVNYLAGDGPAAITTGDFNGDDKIDLATANFLSDDISVFTGNGDGTFAPAVNFGAGDNVTSIATGDFNGDGRTDLATTNYFDDSISVLLGNGDGTFAAAAHYTVGDTPGALTAGDLNGDGRADLAVMNFASGNISMLLANADGTFAAALNFPNGGPGRIRAGDFNGDGKTDLIATNLDLDNIAVLLGNGNGTFTAPVTYAAGDHPTSFATGDFNGDGEIDLALTNNFVDKISVLVGNGDGTFAAGISFAVGDNPVWVTAGDFNGDGRIDLATANVNSDSLSVLLNSCSANTAPVANNDGYSVNEDGSLNGSSVLANDADSDGDPLTAALVSGPANASSFSMNADGSFSYAPNSNFNGSDSFRYKANDGSLDSNIATVMITVNAVNDAPIVSATPKTQPDVQYSDAISPVTVTASDLETLGANLSIAFAYKKNGGPSVSGLPAGMTQGGAGGAWTVSGKANVPAGSYVITASVTDTGDGISPAITSSDTFTIVVTKENAVAAPRLSNPVAMQVASAGGTASGPTGQICFDITEIADGSPGNTLLINTATLQINAVGGGSTASITPSWISFSNVGTASACFFLSLAGTAPNVFEITLNIGGDYYTGSGTTAFIVFDPIAGFASGGGWVINPNTGYRANYGVNVKYLKNGNAQGSILYIEHRPDGDYKFKSTSLNSSGGFAIVPITGGAEAQIAGKGNYGMNGVFAGNHSFIARVIDKGNPGTNDSFGLKLIAPNGQVMNEFTFNPQLLGGGNNQVPKK